MSSSSLHHLCWLTLMFSILTMLACSFLYRPATDDSSSQHQENSTEPASITKSTPDQAATDEPALETPDPLDLLLNLRSIQFDQTTLYPDQTSRSIRTEIDSIGNMHLTFIDPPATLPQESSEESVLSSDSEICVINGTAYYFESEGEGWVSDLEPVDYSLRLSDRLHGSQGPGLWLDLLPEGSLQSVGQETVGGFTANKYNVNGRVADQTITGSLWFDTESHALVQVELHVPAGLLSVSENSAQGELKITLAAEKTDIPAIAVPE